ncbi:hypothetical protein ACS0TY_013251 [Phlomoides rotata]
MGQKRIKKVRTRLDLEFSDCNIYALQLPELCLEYYGRSTPVFNYFPEGCRVLLRGRFLRNDWLVIDHSLGDHLR